MPLQKVVAIDAATVMLRKMYMGTRGNETSLASTTMNTPRRMMPMTSGAMTAADSQACSVPAQDRASRTRIAQASVKIDP